ncbi:hypothetical protein KU306_12035 [Haloferax larsenii]|uniref:Uncharacterized protein n=1 Tax=Haloferax larsenii TaxID=302484 RepID=A0ABY5RDH3_HALLR|nr:hypothetical protein [Haloferax larsenii]UVE49635.1 hypothetical protein KU306_12035 [Haloferax larsenii]
MLTFVLKLIPIGPAVGLLVVAGALQLVGVDVLGMASDFVLDLLGVPDWSGWFDSLL